MTITAKELRRMVQDHIVVQKLINEGVFDDYISNRAASASPEAMMQRVRDRVNKITGQPSASTSDVPAPATFDPGTKTGDTSPPETAEPIDPEDMIEPTEPPAASEDASLKTIFDVSKQMVKDGKISEVMDYTFTMIAGLLALTKKPTPEELIDSIADLGPIILKTYGFDRIARGNSDLVDMMKEAEKNGGKGGDFLYYLNFSTSPMILPT